MNTLQMEKFHMRYFAKHWYKTTACLTTIFTAFPLFAQPIENIPTSHYELEKIIIFSRHGLRSPLTEKGSDLEKSTPYKWANWSVPTGHLTHKGTLLETYFGQYLGQWLTHNGLLDKASCESGKQIEVYANSLQRTIGTAQALVAGGFSGCNVQVKHHQQIGKMDPVFNPIIRSDDQTFVQTALSKIDLNKTHQYLAPSYHLLSEIIDYAHSEKCLQEKQCEFFNDVGKLRIKKDKEPGVSGTMRLSENIVDALLLQYYEGLPLKEIANNQLDSDQKWQTLNKIKNDYQFMLRGDPFIAKHISLPLLKYIQQDLNSENKITLLVGHDSNIIALLSALNVKPYKLAHQYEQTSIGGKVFIEI
ncbi:histidine-type phosphatase [Mannheimia haemolytica]|nr:histidine-type phosphatase [Mannheimia haemolytica]MDW0625022.1 histidine-type phosphatase [Mannheimia haemolytica]